MIKKILSSNLIEMVLAKKWLIAIISGLAVVSTGAIINISSDDSEKVELEKPNQITEKMLRNDGELRMSENQRCKSLSQDDFSKDQACELAKMIASEIAREDYTYRGKPVEIPTQLPGR